MRPIDRVAVLCVAAVVTITTLACNEVFGPHRARPTALISAAAKKRITIPYEFICTGRRRAKHVACARLNDKRPIIGSRYSIGIKRPGGASRIWRKDQVIGGNQGQYMTIGLANFAWDSISNIFSFDATVQNNLRQSMGTIDGTTLSGIKIFFSSGPTCTGGPCYVTNADGTGAFTSDSQPYFFYNQILQPQAISTSKNWQIYLAPAVESFNFAVEAYAAFPAEETTPSVALSSVPDSIYASAHQVINDTAFSLSYLDNILEVEFTQGTAIGDRALAVAKVGGLVVGGAPIVGNDGLYYVQVPVSGYAALSSLIATLDSLGQIDYAQPSAFTDSTNALDYRHPSDGDSARSWHVWPSLSSGPQWAREHIAAPLAWGCDTGDSRTQIAVIDNGFMNLSDLTANVQGPVLDDRNVSVGYIPTTGNRHGTAVASIAAARGNNNMGVTGMMWNADLRLYVRRISPNDGDVTTTNDLRAIVRAALDSARVINMSGGFAIPKGLYHNRPQDSVRIANWISAERDFWVRNLHRLDDTLTSHRLPIPLIVFAAGNDGSDARWNTYPAIRDSASVASQVMVVAASDSGDHRWHNDTTGDTSNFGPLVNIVAPGQRVDALNRDGTGAPFGGTSAAAPLVAGSAGLLVSFNPALDAGDLQNLLVNGATNGNRQSPDGAILNAYESLKRAALQSGVPLCGNRLWSSSGTIWAQRAGSNTEQLATPFASAWNVIAMHGGRRFEYTTVHGRYSVSFNGTAWGSPVQVQDSTTAANSAPYYGIGLPPNYGTGLAPINANTSASDSILGGAGRSVWALNHDGDSAATVVVHENAWGGGGNDTLFVLRGPLQAVLADTGGLDTVGTIWYPSKGLDSVCVVGSAGACQTYLSGPTRWDFPRLAYSPRGDRILLAIDHDAVSHASQGNGTWTVDITSSSVEAYSYSLPSKTRATISTPTGVDVWWWGISEADSTIVAGLGTRDYQQSSDGSQIDHTTGCSVDFRSGDFSTALLSLSTTDACTTNEFLDIAAVYGSGSISPNRVAHRLRGIKPGTTPQPKGHRTNSTGARPYP